MEIVRIRDLNWKTELLCMVEKIFLHLMKSWSRELGLVQKWYAAVFINASIPGYVGGCLPGCLSRCV